jgi:hypothetical protein
MGLLKKFFGGDSQHVNRFCLRPSSSALKHQTYISSSLSSEIIRLISSINTPCFAF